VIVDGTPLIGPGLAGELGHIPVTDGGGLAFAREGLPQLLTSGPGLARAGVPAAVLRLLPLLGPATPALSGSSVRRQGYR